MSIAKISNSSYIYAPNGVNENVKLAIIYDFVSPPFLLLTSLSEFELHIETIAKIELNFLPHAKVLNLFFFSPSD